MNESQEQLYQDLRKWADSRGNWVFCRDLEIYFEYLKQRETEVIDQKPVRELEAKLRSDWGIVSEIKAKS